MCTAITYHTKDHYFGRNLDYETTFGEQVVLMPRKFGLCYKCLCDGLLSSDNHYALLGIAVVADKYPLYFDAVNEKGLAMAGLHFVGNAFYEEPGIPECFEHSIAGELLGAKADIAPYELIPWILSQCDSVKQARELLAQTRLVAVPFNDQLPLSPLHFMIADKECAIVVEPMREGLKIYDNPVGVLTNNPPFSFHLANLNNYMNLTSDAPVNRFSDKLELTPYSRGMGAIGIPGDMSSASRFIRAAFVRANSLSGESEQESISQFFHILGSVEQVRGCVHLEGDKYDITTYACCCNLEKGIYYYKTYEDFKLYAVDMRELDLEGQELVKPQRDC